MPILMLFAIYYNNHVCTVCYKYVSKKEIRIQETILVF